MDNVITDVKNLFNRAKIFLRATANKILSSKTKLDDELVNTESTVLGSDLDNLRTDSGAEADVETDEETESKEKVEEKPEENQEKA